VKLVEQEKDREKKTKQQNIILLSSRIFKYFIIDSKQHQQRAKQEKDMILFDLKRNKSVFNNEKTLK